MKIRSLLIISAGLVAGAAVLWAVKNQQQEKQPEQKTEQKVEEMAIVELPSGLKYKIISKGTGTETPKAGQRITVHYTGSLEDGTVFDSSVSRGQPFKFTVGVGQVIPGWDEGLMLMTTGEKRQLIIPASLGYGPRGIPGVIPGGATLIFDVELIAFQ